MHDIIPHDGAHGNPRIKNAASMIEKCKKEKRGLNCRGLAMALNECYLAMGFKSRYVICLPKDSMQIDRDCHVINMVFIQKLDKWIWIDPSFNVYITDENNIPLSIAEVRERIILNQPFFLNKQANWNGKPITQRFYQDYVTKNLYRFECPSHSRFNTETRLFFKMLIGSIKYIDLLPLDYHKQNIKKYCTNNAGLFWSKP